MWENSLEPIASTDSMKLKVLVASFCDYKLVDSVSIGRFGDHPQTISYVVPVSVMELLEQLVKKPFFLD